MLLMVGLVLLVIVFLAWRLPFLAASFLMLYAATHASGWLHVGLLVYAALCGGAQVAWWYRRWIRLQARRVRA